MKNNLNEVIKILSSSSIWKTGTNLTTQGCDITQKIAIITHGWEGSTSAWIQDLVTKLLKYRGGCVISMNWGNYSDDINYMEVVLIHWKKVSKVLLRRLNSMEAEGRSPDNMYMYGHSLGGRLVIDAGIAFGDNKIFQIDCKKIIHFSQTLFTDLVNISACDAAGPGFYLYDTDEGHNSKRAAKNVQCIHTSVGAGTSVYNCHQDWLMGMESVYNKNERFFIYQIITGNCGISQPASDPAMWAFCGFGLCPNPSKAKLSHNLCNDFFISAFENDFYANNCNNCSNSMDISTLPPNYKMGYMETRRR